jgi:hypothetical protein
MKENLGRLINIYKYICTKIIVECARIAIFCSNIEICHTNINFLSCRNPDTLLVKMFSKNERIPPIPIILVSLSRHIQIIAK